MKESKINAGQEMTRRDLFKLAGVAGTTLLLPSWLTGCSNKQETTISSKVIVPTSTTEALTTTTLTPTTTTENSTTSRTIPDITGSTEGGQTSTTKEKILYSDLVSLEALSPYDVPVGLQQAIKERNNGTIRNPKLFEANDVNLENKISFYLFNVSNESFVGFQKNGQYVVEKYRIKTYVDTDRAQSHLVYASDNGYFLDFYLSKIIPENTHIEPDDVLKEVIKIAVVDLHQDKIINFTSSEKGAIDKIIQVLSPAARYKEQLEKENTTTTTEISSEDKNLELKKKMGSLLLNEGVSIDYIKEHSEFDVFSRIPTSLEKTVPSEIQEKFKKNNPNYKVLWVGEGNRDSELNALITTRPIKADNYSGEIFQADGFGYYHGSEDANFIITREEVAGAEVIGTSVYLKFLNKLTGKYTYSELNLNKKDGNSTGIGITNLDDDFNNPVFEFKGKRYRLFHLLENGHSLDEFIQIGDIVEAIHLGKNEQGVLKIRGIEISGSAERYNKEKQIFDSLPE